VAPTGRARWHLLVLNLVVPGLGSLAGRRTVTGVLQLLLLACGGAGVAWLVHTGVPLVDEGDFRGLSAWELTRIASPPLLLIAAWIWSGATGVLLLRPRQG